MISYTVVYRSACGPSASMRVRASTPERAAEQAARRLGVIEGRFRVYRQFTSRDVVYDGEIQVNEGRAIPRPSLRW